MTNTVTLAWNVGSPFIVTVYTVVTVGDTVIVWVTAVFDHRYVGEAAPVTVAVRVVELPLQMNLFDPAVTLATFRVCDVDAEQLPVVPITERVMVAAGVTVIGFSVDPLLHR